MTAPIDLVAEPDAPRLDGPAPRAGRVKLLVGSGVVGLYVLVGLLAPVIRPHDPLVQDVARALQGPSSAHWLGTDELGRDLLSRLMSATTLDLMIAALATLLPCVLGTVLGLLVGYLGGWVDTIVMRVSDLLQAFPTYILMIVLVFVLGPGVRSLLISFTLVGWVVYARLARGEVSRIREAEYVLAARTAGLGPVRIMARHVLPNSVKQTGLYLTSDLVFAITALAAFSFLGFGIQQPSAEWGSMIASAQPYIADAPRLTIIPGVVISVLAFGLALVVDAAQDRTARR